MSAFGADVSADSLENASWSLNFGGHTFWSLVDSTPSSMARGCRCDSDSPDHDCRFWDHARQGMWCVAAQSNRDRCSRAAAHGTPFCSFHMARAWRALVAVAATQERRGISAEVERRQAENHMRLRHIAHLAKIDESLVWDLGAAAAALPSRVYFYRVGDVVKIGRSIDVDKRIKTLRATAAPAGIDVSAGELLGTIAGAARVETTLHHRFRPYRQAGEWFTYAPIADDIAELISARSVA